MNAFGYVTARTPAAAIEAVRDDGRFLAGGQDLLGELKESLVSPKTLVNIKSLPETAEVRREGATWSIGANVTLAMIAAHIELHRAFPALAEAAAEVGSPQIRNVATIGGNLAQHSRCWYYRHRDVRCRKKGGSTCFARGGESKYHSLFTGSMCLSPCVSNLAIAFAAGDAQVVVQRGRRTERLTIAELYADAWRTAAAHNSLRADDLILRVELPVTTRRSTYLQVAEKGDFDWALVSCAAAAKVDGTRVSDVRLVLGAVAPVPWQVAEAGAFLEGKEITRETADRAAEIVLRGARPLGDNAYKLPIAKALMRRALLKLVAPA
ncbi:MAG TPA: FAD binding domain-containing protein [Opitutaceae bacterium]|nr:FAD binding domain-containing protein [Opitutaceae bacterium]